MSSRIEQSIDELEKFISECKVSKLSSANIIVNKDQIEELISDLRVKTPDEIRRYQKIISNKEAILADAQAKADAIIAQAEVTHSDLVSEHQIMQQAYVQANEVVMVATRQAQDILNQATIDANNYKSAAIAYTDELLANIESVLTSAIETQNARFNSMIGNLSECLAVITANRKELAQPDELDAELEEAANEIQKEEE
ncbi:MAG: ATPase [Lachnospiraceae bacterium]|nr:ATPase [Lachnospiraceae bacterium]